MTELETLQAEQITRQSLELQLLRKLAEKGPTVERPSWLENVNCFYAFSEAEFSMVVDYTTYAILEKVGLGNPINILDTWHAFVEGEWNVAILIGMIEEKVAA